MALPARETPTSQGRFFFLWSAEGSGLLLCCYGALTLAAQVLLLREFLLLARGQEIYLALGFWAWLGWTGTGSWWGGRLAGRSAVSREVLIQLLTVLAVLLPVTLLACRGLPALLGWQAGVAQSSGRLALWFLLLSGPFCLLSGLFFPLACRRLQERSAPAGLIGRAYAWDALGMGLAGLLWQALLWGRWDSLWLALGWCLVQVWLLALWGLPWRRPRVWLVVLGAVILAATAAAAFWYLPAVSRSWQWPGRTLLGVAETRYGVWTAAQEEDQISFAGNGLWFFTYPDPQTSEEQVHFALLQHPGPQSVLLLGGGVTGLVAEISRTPGLRRLDYVELDPGLVELAQRVLPQPAWEPLTQGQVRLIFADARRWLTRSQDRYDVIIMALPEPTSALLNRYYTQEFFAVVRQRLQPQGVFSFGLAGTETALNPVRRSFLSLTAATLRQVFPEVTIFPGVTWRFFAAPRPGVLTADPEVLAARLMSRGLDLLYVREYYWRTALTPQRLAAAQQALSDPAVGRNRDDHPRGVFYGLMLAGLEADSFLPRLLPWLDRLWPGTVYLGLSGLTLVLLFVRRHWPAGQTGPLYSVFAVGVAAMGLEMVVLILFQVTLGYVYGQLSLLLAAFMLGLAGGAAGAGAGLARGWRAQRLGSGCQIGLSVLLTALAAMLPRLLEVPWLRAEGWGQLSFASLLLAGGLLSGAVFAAQGDLLGRRGETAAGAGRLYAVDLLGATVGTVGLSFLIIPCWGPAQALFLAAAWNASAAAVTLAANMSTQQRLARS